MCNSPVVRAKWLNCTTNRTPGHVLSNNGLCQCTAAQYVLLFLVFGKFRPVSNFTYNVVTSSYSSRPFLCAFAFFNAWSSHHVWGKKRKNADLDECKEARAYTVWNKEKEREGLGTVRTIYPLLWFCFQLECGSHVYWSLTHCLSVWLVWKGHPSTSLHVGTTATILSRDCTIEKTKLKSQEHS